MNNVKDDGFRDLAAGAFTNGLAKLNADPAWHDDRLDLEGPFRLAFPGAKGWGEELLVASLLKRHAAASSAVVPVFASEQVCWILKQDSAFLPQPCRDSKEGRPPLAIIRHALIGDLLEKPFVPLAQIGDTRPSKIDLRPYVGIAWGSLSNNCLISEKSIPVERFLASLSDIEADLISLQRKLNIADPTGLTRILGVRAVADEILDARTEPHLMALVKFIMGLEYSVTISTTTAHIAAAMGMRVELIAAQRERPQWFWQVQASHGKCLYPTVRVHMGNGRKNDWWENSLQSFKHHCYQAAR